MLRTESENYLRAAAGRLLSDLIAKREGVLACEFWERIAEYKTGDKLPLFYAKEQMPDEFTEVPTGLTFYMQPVITSMRKWELIVSVYNLAEGWKMSRVLRVGTREEILDCLETKIVKEELEKNLIHLTEEIHKS